MTTADDLTHMTAALALARRGLGDTSPNPAVGCVLVRGGRVIGRGWTQSGGRPHAEAEALIRAGDAKGATAYVSLEPCSHQGKTPPCADALIAAGVARAVIATRDPDPRVNGSGLERLRAGGLIVEEGLRGEDAAALNRGFFLRIAENRPLFALKTATALDGGIALASGASRWITGARARDAVQAVRASYDAIMVGSQTAIADDPMLTCRLPGYVGRPKPRIVMDRRLRLPIASRLVQTAKDVPTWVVTSAGNDGRELEARGVTVIAIDNADFLRGAGAALAARGLTRVMIEGGGQIASAFLKAGLIDELAWFRAGRVLGADARPSVGELGVQQLSEEKEFRRVWSMELGDDVLDVYQRRASR